MTTKLAGYIKQERNIKGLNTAQLSKIMGYKNINKGMRRIIDLERDGIYHPEVLEKIIEALKLDRDKVDLLIQEDKDQQQKEFKEWVNTPIKWHLIIRWMPAVYGEREIPGYIKTKDEAVEYAKSYAKEKQLMLWLVLSRKENIQFDSNGIVKSRNVVTLDNGWLPSSLVGYSR